MQLRTYEHSAQDTLDQCQIQDEPTPFTDPSNLDIFSSEASHALTLDSDKNGKARSRKIAFSTSDSGASIGNTTVGLSSRMSYSLSGRLDYSLSSIGSSVDSLSSSPSSRISHSISSFSLIGTLGYGSYGKVLLGCLKDTSRGDLCAIKVIRKSAPNNRFGSPDSEVQREITTLEWIAARIRQAGPVFPSVHFLQNTFGHFQDDMNAFIILVNQ